MPALIGVSFIGKKKKPATMEPPPFPGAKKEEKSAAAPAPAPKKPTPAVAKPPAAPAAPAPAKPKGLPVGDEPEATPDGDEGSLRPEDVGYKSGELCGSCAHMGEDGNCVRYSFPVTEDGHCLAGYEPKHEEMGEGMQPMEGSEGGEEDMV